MITTKNNVGTPRILVRISYADRLALTEKTIITEDGRAISLCLRNVTREMAQADRWDLSVRVGRVEAIMPGCGNIQVGDLAILDYVVDGDSDDQGENDSSTAENVLMEDRDKLVSVPCVTRLHQEPIYVTSYGQWVRDPQTQKPIKFIVTGETNRLVAQRGDHIDMSLVLGVIRGTQLLPNPAYVFAAYEEQEYSSIFKQDGETYYELHDTTHIVRKVLFADPATGLRPGDTIHAIYDSNIEVTILDQIFEVIPFCDILAVDKGFQG
ncbi:hypothetical protein PV783_34310 [Chitinophaga sp. CC14]|uniref:hypothetical protein n=1 Tax=Chitinophaga sp. CC14 TaxID=3029199 RepID=UPI003B81A0AD